MATTNTPDSLDNREYEYVAGGLSADEIRDITESVDTLLRSGGADLPDQLPDSMILRPEDWGGYDDPDYPQIGVTQH